MPRKKMTPGQIKSREARKKLLEYRPMAPTGKYDPQTGKPLMERKSYYYERSADPKKQAANKALAQAEHQDYLRLLLLGEGRTAGQDGEPLSSPLVRGTVDWYLAERIAPLHAQKPHNTRRSIQNASDHLSRIAGSTMVKDVKAPEIARIMAMVPGSPSLKNKVRDIAYQVNEIAAEEDESVRLISRRRVKPVKQKAPRLVVQTPRECMAVALSVSPQYRMGAMIQAVFGARAGESSAPLWMDLTPLGTLTLVRQDDELEGSKEELKNEESVRELPIPKGLGEMLRAHREEERKQGRGKPSDPISATRNGTAVMEGNLRRAIQAARKRLGMPDYKGRPCHIFRHSLASWLDKEGCPEGIRLAILGQSRDAVKDRYVHAGPAEMLPWIERWWKEASGAAPAPLIRTGGAKRPATGENNGRARLNALKHASILAMLDSGVAIMEIARREGVSAKTVRNVRDGKAWGGRLDRETVQPTTTSAMS